MNPDIRKRCIKIIRGREYHLNKYGGTNVGEAGDRDTAIDSSSRSDDYLHPLVQFLQIRSLEDIRVGRCKDGECESVLHTH